MRGESKAILVFLCLIIASSTMAQDYKWFRDEPKPITIDWDTNYYVKYTEQLVTRLYTSVKYTAFRVANPDTRNFLIYETNRNTILGFGATYGGFTLNIGLNFPFINGNDQDKYGDTRYLDLQTHVYLEKMSIDIFVQLFDGFFLSNSEEVLSDWPDKDTFQVRPDMRALIFGLNWQYLFNYRKFSFKAAYQQDAWQKKSAGTWVAGANAYYNFYNADSSIVPANLNPPDMLNGATYNRQDILNIGVSGGYYYNLVITKHVFLSAGIAGGPSLGYTWYNMDNKNERQKSGIKLGFNWYFRASLGYNSRRFFIGTSILNQMLFNELPTDDIWTALTSGNYRIYVAYRFGLKKPIKLVNPRYWNFFPRSKERKKNRKEKKAITKGEYSEQKK